MQVPVRVVSARNRISEASLRAPADASVICAAVLTAFTLGTFAVLFVAAVFVVVLFVVS